MNLGVIRHKIWYDLWENKGRTLRVVLIIAIGAFAVGMIIGGNEFLNKDLTRTWRASTPATIGLDVNPPVDDEIIQSLENLRGIETVIGWSQEIVRWRRTPKDTWEPTQLYAIDDYEEQEIRNILLDEGNWPYRRMMGVQRGRGVELGEQVYLEIDDREYEVEMNGLLYNAAIPPPMMHPEPTFYTTRERFEQLTGEPNYNLVLATIPNYSRDRVEVAANLIQDRLEKQGIEVKPALPVPGGFKTRTGHPDRFVAQDVVDGVSLILRVMAGLSLVLGMFLAYNTINALISQQVDQIGIMKAVGANFNQVLYAYLIMVVIYAALALLIAVPLGALGAHGLRLFMISRFGMIPGPFEISNAAVTIQIVVVLLSTLLTAIVPIFSGARVTVREAISTYGLDGASNLLDQVLVKMQFIPRIVALTVSNTFRNKTRVLLTQITLAGAGAIFMMVLNTQASLVNTFSNELFSIFKANVMLDLQSVERISQVEALTLALPEVKAVEVWGTARGTARPMGQPASYEDNAVQLRGIPLPAITYIPQMRAGRWLQVDDQYAVVLNQALAQEIGVSVGDWITLDIPGQRESDWQVVGLVFEPLDQDTALMPRDTLLYEIGQVGRGRSVRIQTIHEDAAGEWAVATALRTHYEANSYEVIASSTDTAHQLIEQRVNRMDILLTLLSSMAVVIAIVGAIALSGTLSINVMERTREIGVMRAIGASALAVAGQFVGEGLILGWLSWLIAIPLSIPAAQLLISILSILINIELVYQFSGRGVLYWLVIVTVLAIIASWFPAQRAAQTSVRESLAYV
ncbi:ABC transporter permease [Chloroflexota bacterium]